MRERIDEWHHCSCSTDQLGPHVVHRPLSVLLVLVGQPGGQLLHPGDAGLLAVGETAAKVAEANVPDGELDEDEVDQKELRRVVVGVYERGKLFFCCMVDQVIVGGKLGKGWNELLVRGEGCKVGWSSSD